MMNIHKAHRRIAPMTIGLAGLLLAGPAGAQDPDLTWYDVEIIIFAHQDPAIDSEQWPEEPGIADTLSAVELLTPPRPRPQWQAQGGETGTTTAPMPVPFQRLPRDDYGLAAIASRLEGSDNHELLLHIAWRQPGFPDDEAVPVHIHETLADARAAANDEAATLPSMSADALGEPMAGPPLDGAGWDFGVDESAIPIAADSTYGMPTPPRLDGTVTLKRSRYLHVDADLVYRLPMEMPFNDLVASVVRDETETDSSMIDENAIQSYRWFQSYRMREQRRMRSDELHYMDHPIIGIVVRVTPYVMPEVLEKPATRQGGDERGADNATVTPSPSGGVIER